MCISNLLKKSSVGIKDFFFLGKACLPNHFHGKGGGKRERGHTLSRELKANTLLFQTPEKSTKFPKKKLSRIFDLRFVPFLSFLCQQSRSKKLKMNYSLFPPPLHTQPNFPSFSRKRNIQQREKNGVNSLSHFPFFPFSG